MIILQERRNFIQYELTQHAREALAIFLNFVGSTIADKNCNNYKRFTIKF